MSLSPGTKLGPYEILSALGAGGMGEVYRARDTKLNRDVAIKVLLPAVANDPDRLARFSREAQVLASLNHPNIAHIYGIEDAAIVMELVEGEDLAQRIARGPIPLDEALPIARQIAEALEAAHDHGIIHRDLKPANIKVRPDGTVKVLDFGLAKAVDPTAGSSATAMNSPTLSIHATQTGIILGTAAYMSPEQARGKAVDKRTDIWALGCVLFEMLTGKRAFPGDDATDTIVAVVSKDPDWSALPAIVPPAIKRLLRRSLEKDPKRRLDSAGGARIEIDDALAAPSSMDSAVTQAALRERSFLPRALPWMVAGALAAGLVFVLAFWEPRQTASAPVSRSVITPPSGAAAFSRSKPVLSPDGTQIVFAAGGQLYLRSLDHFDARPIAGTTGATVAFFSPDGKWLGFFAKTKLQKTPLQGGAPIELVEVVGGPSSASWGPGGMIVFSPADGSRGLFRITDSGGDRQVIASPTGADETAYRWPEIMPDGGAVVFTVMRNSGSAIVAELLKTGQRRVLIEGGADARFVSPGHLVYRNAGNLMAVAFDPRRVETAGVPIRVIEDLSYGDSGAGVFGVSSSGTLVYAKGGLVQPTQRFVWVDRTGQAEPLAAPTRAYNQFRLSPDGRQIAVQLPTDARNDIATYDIERKSLTRLTFESNNSFPFWTPDGTRVTYQRRNGAMAFQKLANGGGAEEPLTKVSNSELPEAWSADGKELVSIRRISGGGSEVWVTPMADVSKARPILKARSTVEQLRVSHDGRWLAYISNESGRWEVYVQPLAGGGAKWQISTEGGMEPLWSNNGRELFYRNAAKMMAVNVTTASEFKSDTPRVLFEKQFRGPTIPTGQSGVSADGQRFLMLETVDGEKPVTEMNIVLNWAEELKRLLPTAKQ
jgi:serine/threonine-protein kinase